jgi:hypothetical protein
MMSHIYAADPSHVSHSIRSINSLSFSLFVASFRAFVSSLSDPIEVLDLNESTRTNEQAKHRFDSIRLSFIFVSIIYTYIQTGIPECTSNRREKTFERIIRVGQANKQMVYSGQRHTFTYTLHMIMRKELCRSL